MNENAFEKHHLKKTKNRERILSALMEIDHPCSVEELFFHFEKGSIDLSTIYRTMQAFEKSGMVLKEVNEKKENVYSLIKKEDSHILVCLKCHKRIPLPFCPFEEVNEKIEKATGFHLKDQNIELYGICKDCQEKEK